MSAAAETQSHEFGSGNNMMLLDLNLSLHHYSTTTPTTTNPSPPSQPPPQSHKQHHEPYSAVSPTATDRKVVVDLTTKSISNSTVGGSQSQNSTLSCTRKRTHHDHQHPVEMINETHLLILPAGGRGGGGSDEDDLDGENSRKKLRLSRDQSHLLEDTFKHHNTLNPRQKQALAKQLGLSARQVEVWFQNRRARTKLKQTEAECEYMKRNCETLMDHVRRLQKEVNELRALKLAPQIYMQMPPATTLALCPSCERVGSVSGNLRTPSNTMIHKPF